MHIFFEIFYILNSAFHVFLCSFHLGRSKHSVVQHHAIERRKNGKKNKTTSAGAVKMQS